MIHYVIGIDVGLRSTGLAAIALDDSHDGLPRRILNMQSVIHDAGVDPNGEKAAMTRLAKAGIARRARRMVRRRRERLRKLDALLEQYGYVNAHDVQLLQKNMQGQSYNLPWLCRGELASHYIADATQRKRMIAIALRAIARHRGWRNPYKNTLMLHQVAPYSNLYEACVENINKRFHTAISPDEKLTIGQLICRALTLFEYQHDAPSLLFRYRGQQSAVKGNELNSASPQFPLLVGKLMQSDLANEILRICEVQRVPVEERNCLIDAVFAAHSPRGSAADRVGLDPVNPREHRALRASLIFQQYRIIATLANLRVQQRGSEGSEGSGAVTKPLSIEQRRHAYEFLCKQSRVGEVTWDDVADALDVSPSDFRGIGQVDELTGERIGAAPPQLDSAMCIFNVGHDAGSLTGSAKTLRAKLQHWWKAPERVLDDRESMIELLSNAIDVAQVEASDDERYAAALEFLDGLDEDELGKLDEISLPSGRAAYGVSTMRKLSDWMLTHAGDLAAAREQALGLSSTWRPPQDPIGKPVGNPSVDRVLKIVNRYIMLCTQRWGKPERITIEHVRSAFASEKKAREYEQQVKRREELRAVYAAELQKSYEGNVKPSLASIRRLEAIQRQNGHCLYCDAELQFTNCELDHIVPRKGAGSSNAPTNLAAVCIDCNRNKANTLFPAWCASGSAYVKQQNITLKAALDRVDDFTFAGKTYNAMQIKNFKNAVKQRLRKTREDDAIDSRSMESVAWMADELHRRIDWYYNAAYYTRAAQANLGSQIEQLNNVKRGLAAHEKPSPKIVEVHVFSGAMTDSAKRASGIAKSIAFIGEHTKTRFDRRHHAVDAAIIALLRPSVATVLVERNAMREEQKLEPARDSQLCWKDVPTPGHPSFRMWVKWRRQMQVLLKLMNAALYKDQVPVLRSQRLELSNAAAHDDTVHPLQYAALGDAMSADLIRRASTPALWCALTRLPEYDVAEGLPANPARVIHVQGTRVEASDRVSFFKSSAAQLTVRGGSVEIGNAIHHARLYRCSVVKGKQVKVFYGMIRVFQADLLVYRHENLFTCALPPQSISMRYAEPKVAQAVLQGNAEYLGYLALNDEIVIDAPAQLGSDQNSEFIRTLRKANAIPAAYQRWVIKGFYSSSKLRLKPSLLAEEGLEAFAAWREVSESTQITLRKQIDMPGWHPSINALAAYHPRVIRRNGFGEERWKSQSHLPVSYAWRDDEQ